VVILYSDKISLSADDILEKDFKIDARGYRPQEVDKFLDLIISDYTEFSTIIKRQDKEIKALTEENRKLKQEYNKLHSRMEAAADEGSTRNPVNNVDLLRRISQLEKIVFGKDE
jgi:DivIVA domain-containing protein